MAEKNIEKDTLKSKKDADKAVEKAKKERIKQSKPKKEGNPFSRGGAAIKKFCKDFVGTCKKVSWPTGKQVIKNSGVVLATIVVIGIAVALVDLALTEVFKLSENAIAELGDKNAVTTEAAVGTTSTTGNTSSNISLEGLSSAIQDAENESASADASENESATGDETPSAEGTTDEPSSETVTEPVTE